MSETKKLYEVGYLLLSTLSDEQVAEAAKAVRDTVESNGGSVTKEEAPKFKRLAYSMRKKIDTKYQDFDSAYFGYIIFEAEASAVGSIESNVGMLPAVLRRLVVKDPVLDRLVDADATEEEDERPVAAEAEAEEGDEVSDEELDKSIDKAVGEADEAELKSE